MSKEVLLVIFGIVVLLIIWVVRWQLIKPGGHAPLTSKKESALRIVLCILFALIACALFPSGAGLTFAISVGFSALITYAVTHLLDRLILGG